MNLNQLEYFLVCAKHGSLTKAAEELYTTQPHVSMMIRSLEEELGVTLFQRRARGVELTEDGKGIYLYASNALKNTDLIASLCREKSHPALRIATNPSSHMAGLLTNYYQNRQDGDLFLRYTECGIEQMLTLIGQRSYDLGFLFAPDHKQSALFHMLERRHLEFVPLLSTDLVLYVGMAHPLYGADSVSPRQLSELQFIQLEDDFFAIEDMLYDLPEFRKGRETLNRVVRTNSSYMMIQMLDQTELCNVGSYWLKNVYRQYNFGRIPVEGFQGKISYGYIKYCDRPLDPPAQDFLEFLRQAMERDEIRDI